MANLERLEVSLLEDRGFRNKSRTPTGVKGKW
jgi:hypothetical protein